jgi:hypothetical protein
MKLQSLVVAASCGVLAIINSTRIAQAQPATDEVTLQFKVYLANKPEDPPLDVADFGTIEYRNKNLDLPNIKFDLPIKHSADKTNEITVKKGVLIEQLVVQVLRPDTNPAVVTKLVTADKMTLFPGASGAKEEFSIFSYLAQVNTYRGIFIEFVEQVPADQREGNRSNLLKAFGRQLEDMSDVNARLPKASDGEKAKALKAITEVVRLYKNIPEPPQPKCCVPYCYQYQGCWCRRRR